MISTENIPKKTSLLQRISLILFGLFLTIIILEIGLRIGGFTILSMQEHRNLQSIKQKGSFRIMCLGESTTRGQYPPYLEEILNQRNIGIKFSVIDKGLAGTNTAAILVQLEANLDKYSPDIVVTMMGCNDGEGVMYYKDIPEANKGLFQHCRLYRFGRLVYMHVLTKLKKEGIYRLNNPSSGIKTKLDSKSDKKDPGVKNVYQNNRELFEKEQSLKKTIELNPNNDSVYIELGWIYRHQGKFIESEQASKKAIELNPNNDSVYIGLGWLYKDQGKFAESEQVFKKAIEINPNSSDVYLGLGQFYREQRRFAEAEQSFKKAVELNPNNDVAYTQLGQLCRQQGRFTESEQLLKKAIELNPKNDTAYGGLATIYSEIGNNKLSEVYAKKADSLKDEYFRPSTVNNYRMFKQILDKRKIKLVCVQYPIHSVESLKKIFREELDSIVFVDNEKIFKDAVRKEGYKEYFKDIFGGDFGHCTAKGNRLLAENIANVILKEIFGK